MRLSLSHPIHDRLRRLSQSQTQKVDLWSRLKDEAQKKSDRILFYEILPARFSGADDSVVELLCKKLKKFEEKVDLYDRADTTFWPINSGIPRDSIDAARSAMESIRSNEPHTAIAAQIESENLAANFFASTIPIPPGSTIRSTPRRPGAPSFALRINH